MFSLILKKNFYSDIVVTDLTRNPPLPLPHQPPFPLPSLHPLFPFQTPNHSRLKHLPAGKNPLLSNHLPGTTSPSQNRRRGLRHQNHKLLKSQNPKKKLVLRWMQRQRRPQQLLSLRKSRRRRYQHPLQRRGRQRPRSRVLQLYLIEAVLGITRLSTSPLSCLARLDLGSRKWVCSLVV